MSEYINPQWSKAYQRDKTVGTPLFDSVRNKPVPPMVKTRSRTKNQVYHDRVADGTLNASRKKVRDLIALHGTKHYQTEGGVLVGITIQDLEKEHGVRINEGSGRSSELVDLGEIIIVGTYKNPKTKRPNTIYRAVTICLPGETSLKLTLKKK